MATSNYITGFCGTGAHEGSRPKTYTGKPRKTCPSLITYREKAWKCTCTCHSDLDKLFEMSGMERVFQDNPEYIPVKLDAIMPSLEERAARFATRDATPPVVVQSALPDRVPATIMRSFTPPPSGRTARGQLELWVKQACDQWILDNVDASATPQYISDFIADKHGVKPPSVGAVDAVYKRWDMIGYAMIAKKPTRFIGYMPDGVKYGLEGLKERYKRNNKGFGR